MKALPLTFLLAFTLLGFSALAQQNGNTASKANRTADLVRNKNFSFVASTIYKRNEEEKNVNFSSSVTVADNIVTTDLYLDRRFPGSPNTIPSNFLRNTIADLTYAVKEKRANTFQIDITPHDQSYIKSLELNIAADGEARANVMLKNGEIINYRGYITDAASHIELSSN